MEAELEGPRGADPLPKEWEVTKTQSSRPFGNNHSLNFLTSQYVIKI